MIKVINGIRGKYDAMSESSKASLWYTGCNVLLKGLALLSTPIFTRILTQTQYGQYALFQSWYSIISIFATLNLFQSVYNKGLLVYEGKEKEFTSSLLGLSTTITILLAIVCLCNMDLCELMLGLPRTLICVMFVELLVMTAVEFWAARERFAYKYKKYAVVTVLTTVLSVTIGIVAVVLNDVYKVEARVFADVFSKAVFGLPLYIYIFSMGKKFFSKEYWRYALVFNLPLIPHFLSTFILNQADRIMIGRMEGEAQAAIYSIAYTIATMMVIVVTALNNALTPFIYRSIKEQKYKEIFDSTKTHFVIIALLCTSTMIFAPEIIAIFAGVDYYEAIWIIPAIAISVYFIFVYAMFSSVEYYFQKTGLLATASMATAVINIVLNYIFISKYGYYAAGYTTLVSYILLSIFHYVYYKMILKKEIEEEIQLFNVKLIVMLSILLVVTMLLMLFLYNSIWIRYGFVIIAFIVIIVKREFLIKEIKGLLEKK